MNVSFHGIGQWFATFLAPAVSEEETCQTVEGAVVKVGGQGLEGVGGGDLLLARGVGVGQAHGHRVVGAGGLHIRRLDAHQIAGRGLLILSGRPGRQIPGGQGGV